MIFFIKSVKTGSRLLSVTLPLHNSSSGSVTSTDVCERERSLEDGSVGRVREGKYMQPRSRAPICSRLRCFLFINRRKARLHKRVTEVIHFCFSKRNMFPTLTQATTFRCVVRHFLVDIRAHSNSYTRVWFFPGFLLKKSQIMQDQSLCAFHLAYL